MTLSETELAKRYFGTSVPEQMSYKVVMEFTAFVIKSCNEESRRQEKAKKDRDLDLMWY